ncbi:hypothetical protein [Sphingobium sp. AP50]|uniref:hypothetical protein n=1 Tax=Sphingobium sp. AP50 TaxID=1884369 RepID=UPI00210EBE3D|nr:hypothetical protein [Sphingobium sp. AP50]
MTGSVIVSPCTPIGVVKLLESEGVPIDGQNVAVVDVGINHLLDGRIIGDLDFEGLAQKASEIIPVPGGVGPMTVDILLDNTIAFAERTWAVGVQETRRKFASA